MRKIIKFVSKFIPDSIYLKIRYYLTFNKKLCLKEPKTFNEKLQWLKLNDRKVQYTKMVDKYLVREYVKNIIGEEYLIPLLGVWDSFEEIDFNKLPDQFVLKCTHDSGGIRICTNKEEFDFREAKKFFQKRLKQNFYLPGREWPYKNVKPRIIAETYIKMENNMELPDYKFMCFNGKAKCIFTCTERFSKDGLKVTFFDENWNVLPFERHYPKSNKLIEKPKRFDEMLKIAEILSEGIPFVRVDLYDTNGKIYFGELTFYPGSGFEEFTPPEWDLKIGNLIYIHNDRR